VIRRFRCRRCPSDGAYGAEIHKLRADGVDDSGSVFGQVWTIQVSDKVVAPADPAHREPRPRQDVSISGIVMELSGIWAICPFQGRCGRHFGLAGPGTRIE
jgi:hypothetical protein